MTYKELKLKIKEQQKSLAQQIKRGKTLRKPCNRIDVTPEDRKLYYSSWGESDGFAYWKVGSLSNDYRHIHIAYCTMFFKTPYDKIELSCKESPDFDRIDSRKKQWEGLIDEALLDCA